MYTLLVDYGKPFELKVKDDAELTNTLKMYKEMAQTEEYPYFDVIVLNERDEDITESQFISEIIGSFEND